MDITKTKTLMYCS